MSLNNNTTELQEVYELVRNLPAAGSGIQSITFKEQVTEGNVYTVLLTDGSSYEITAPKGPKGDTGATGPAGKDGATGATGPAGKDGSDANVTAENVAAALGYTPANAADVEHISNEKADKTALSLGIGADGLIYIHVNGVPVGTGIAQVSGGDVIGYVDENNNIILTGTLLEDNYTVRYEMEDGTTVHIGELSFVEEVEPVNQFIATSEWINKYISSSSGAFSTRNGFAALKVDGIDLANNKPYTVKVHGIDTARDSGDGAWGRVALLNASGGLVKYSYISDAMRVEDADGWHFDLHSVTSDASVTSCNLCLAINSSRTAITLADVANLFVEFEPLNK